MSIELGAAAPSAPLTVPASESPIATSEGSRALALSERPFALTVVCIVSSSMRTSARALSASTIIVPAASESRSRLRVRPCRR